MARTGGPIAARIFMLMVGVAIAVSLYFIQLDSIQLPIPITFIGQDISKYVLAIIMIAIGILAGIFIKYGYRGTLEVF